MFLEYYKGNIPNFGDDLNPFLWKTLFPNQFINNDGIGFVGVGSVIDQRLDQSQKKNNIWSRNKRFNIKI